MAKISIGMPVYNGEKDIKRAIDSLLAQTFKDFELFISDNASTDLTQCICLEYAKKDKRVIYSRNSHNFGALKNFQAVLEKANAEYFFWASHDDYWHSKFIETAISELDIFNAAAGVMGVVHYLNAAGEELSTHSPPYQLASERAVERVTSYLKSGITDNLIYGVYRTNMLKSAPFIPCLYPEKVLIMHCIINGIILDAANMEYYNIVSFKDRDEVVATLQLNRDPNDEEARVFFAIVSLLFRGLSLWAFIKVIFLYIYKNNWHKFFLKRILHIVFNK